MIFIQISGGLGNQMFQYTFARYLEKTMGAVCALETNFFNNASTTVGYTDRKFELGNYNTHFIRLEGDYKYRTIITEKEFTDHARAQDLTIVSGYWQDKSYFERIKDEVRTELTLKDEFITEDMKSAALRMASENSVSMHVRRGDYTNSVNKDLFCELTADYYEKALNIIDEETGGDLHVYVFSDDIDYVRSEFYFLRNFNCDYMIPGKAYEDLFLMSKAGNHITANSTYSWWGAALSDNNGITVTPSKWFKAMSKPDLDLDTWVVI